MTQQTVKTSAATLIIMLLTLATAGPAEAHRSGTTDSTCHRTGTVQAGVPISYADGCGGHGFGDLYLGETMDFENDGVAPARVVVELWAGASFQRLELDECVAPSLAGGLDTFSVGIVTAPPVLVPHEHFRIYWYDGCTVQASIERTAVVCFQPVGGRPRSC